MRDPRQDFCSPFWPVAYRPLTTILGALGPFFLANAWKIGLIGGRRGWVEVPPYGTLEVQLPPSVSTFDAWTPGNPTEVLCHLSIGTLYRCIALSRRDDEALRRLSDEDRTFLERTLWVRSTPVSIALAARTPFLEVPCGRRIHRVAWGPHRLHLAPTHCPTGLDLAYHLDIPATTPCEILYRAYSFLADPGDAWRILFIHLTTTNWCSLVRRLGGQKPLFA
jgi:hypothetical protein